MWIRFVPCLIVFHLASIGSNSLIAQDTVPSEEEQLQQQFQLQIVAATQRIMVDPGNVSHYSQRGDAYFFSGDFVKAVVDYDKMVELDPAVDTSHWRRGIAYFYAGQYSQAAAQFERYHSFDNVDRENGIWRYLSQYRSTNATEARKELLKYEKDDREPFGDVYLLFSSKLTGEEILSKIQKAELSAKEREKRLFYASLYIGLNEAVEGREDSALVHFTQATKNTWAPSAGYGPHYMWQVARLHRELLGKTPKQE